MKQRVTGLIVAALVIVWAVTGLAQTNLTVVRHSDNTLWAMTCDGLNNCSAWTQIQGGFSMQPTLTWDPALDKYILIGIGNNQTSIWRSTFNAFGTWNKDWTKITGASPSPVAVTAGNYDTLTSLICSPGQIPKWNGSIWVCAADDVGTSAPSSSTVANLDGISSAGGSGNYSRGDHKHGITPGSINGTMIGDGQITDSKITGPIAGAKISSTGLNADTLDGQHATDFAASSHNHNTLYYTKAEVDALISNLQAQVAALQGLLQGITRSGNDVLITGANLHIRSGSGSTNGTVNGLGNIIIGYNEPGSSSVRSGSHNMIIGLNNNYSSFGGMVVGSGHTISGPYATITGGYNNTASGWWSSVTGGSYNSTTGFYSSVSGGENNISSNSFSSVSGGRYNVASGRWGHVSGGGGETDADGNQAYSEYSSILGGASNVTGVPSSPDHTIGTQSSVSGGYMNKAIEAQATVSGGHLNIASGIRASISGGYQNTASAIHSSVSGGSNNVASGNFSYVGGGDSNTASGYQSTGIGGSNNSASGPLSLLSGGGYNQASGDHSSVFGGGDDVSFQGNSASGNYSTVSGGIRNTASALYSSVYGGWYNWVKGEYSTITGGQGLIWDIPYSWAQGCYSCTLTTAE